MNEPIPFDFHGDQLLLVDVNGQPQVVLKPAFEAIGLDGDKQVKNVRAREWARTSVTAVRDSTGRMRQMVTADVRTFLMALATIPAARVNEGARAKLVAYQTEVADAIEAYWTKGGVINPRATADQLDELRGQASVLQALVSVVDSGWLDAKGRMLAARALGEKPMLDPATAPLTVSMFLEGKPLSAKEIASMAPTFGKRLKAVYMDAFGAGPPTMEIMVQNRRVPVCQYQEKHRSLFEQVWHRHYSAPVSPVRGGKGVSSQ